MASLNQPGARRIDDRGVMSDIVHVTLGSIELIAPSLRLLARRQSALYGL